ncbi:MAG: CRTAC1 family protein, partial [Phycisphaerae bacterium]
QHDGGGHFLDRTLTSGIPLLNRPSGVIAFDYDADGDLDLYITQNFSPAVLARNDGGFSFTNTAPEAGVDHSGPSEGAAAGDFDGDGRLDLYVGLYGEANRFYHNTGDGRFKEIAAELGVDDDGRAWQVVFFDADRDGDADLYVSNDKRWHFSDMRNRFYENIGGVFVDRSAESEADANIYSMGVAIGDFDGNLFLDLYCTNLAVESNALFLNRGIPDEPADPDDSVSFLAAEELAGVESHRLGWGAVFFDYDNDGHQDLYVCNESAPNRLYRHVGRWPAVDVAPELGLDDSGGNFCAAVADIDADGDLDVLENDAGQRIRLYINHEGENRRWARFRIVGPPGDAFAVGAIVDVRTNRTWRTREVIAGSNLKSQNELIQHVGLGDAGLIDEVVVTWPGGTTRRLYDLPVNTTFTITPPE